LRMLASACSSAVSEPPRHRHCHRHRQRRPCGRVRDRGVHPAIDDELVRIWRYTSIVWEPEDTIEFDLRATARVARLLTDSAGV